MRSSFLLALVALVAAAGPVAAPHSPSHQFTDFIHAPPMRPRVIGPDGRLRSPFVYPLRLESRLERRYVEDRARPMPLQFLSGGSIVSVAPSAGFSLVSFGNGCARPRRADAAPVWCPRVARRGDRVGGRRAPDWPDGRIARGCRREPGRRRGHARGGVRDRAAGDLRGARAQSPPSPLRCRPRRSSGRWWVCSRSLGGPLRPAASAPSLPGK